MSEYTDALKKKALGYTAEETVEEYNSVDGRLELIKRKVTEKHVPPDLSALKIFIDGTDDLLKLSVDELRSEKLRLLKELKEIEENNETDQN